jgi:hypothetical protein
MRRLRIVTTIVGGAPILTATIASCGSEQPSCPGLDAAADTTVSDVTSDGLSFPDVNADAGADANNCPQGVTTQLVLLPQPGVPADPAELCAVTPPASSNTAARVIFTNYDPTTETAIGFIAVPPNLLGSVIGTPTLTVTTASDPKFAQLVVSNVAATYGGFQFAASWPALGQSQYGGSMTIKTTMTVSCGDGGTEVVEALTPVNYCATDENRVEFVSAGDACTVCTIIAEMAPSPIVSDVLHDGLPLARVIRIVVRELARAGRSVVLMAENDAGEGADYEWRVSKGSVREIAPDVVLWTLPDGVDRPFGQVAVWNDDGAVVENFVWGLS